jgi:hypothetical protein
MIVVDMIGCILLTVLMYRLGMVIGNMLVH